MQKQRICTHNCTHKKVQICDVNQKLKIIKPAKIAVFQYYMTHREGPI